MQKRRGFTLIEVIVALGILMIVVLFFLGSYYSYYRNVQEERYKNIGENLAQLQLEDIQNLPVSILKILVANGKHEPNYPIDNNNSTTIYDSNKIDGRFTVSRLTDVDGLSSYLPSGVGLLEYDETNPEPPPDNVTFYDVTLYDKIYPGYKKEIIIEDMTASINEDSRKLFKISVKVFWAEKGVEKHVTVEGLKSDTGYTK